MESDLTESALFYKLWAWADKNRKQLMYGLFGVILVGVIVAFWLVHAHEKQKDANAELSKLTTRIGGAAAAEPTPDAFLKVTSDYPDTDAGQRALLLAAGNLYVEGKYDLARAQFQKFVQDYNSSPFAGQAALGEASCSDALGKTNDAITGYQAVLDRFGSQNVAPQAQLRMAQLLEGQGKYREARSQLEDLSRKYQGTMIGSEGMTQLQKLIVAHPETQPAVSAAGTPGITVTPTTPAVTAPKTSADPATPAVTAPKTSTAPATNKAP